MAASIILPSICSHQVALPANNYTGMHLLKLMRGAPAGGDTRRHQTHYFTICLWRQTIPLFPLNSPTAWLHGAKTARLWSAFKWCFIAMQTNDDKSFVSHQTCALTCGIFQPWSETTSAHVCNFVVLRQAGNLVSLILTLTVFCCCSICMLLWNHMPLLMQLRCCVSLMP